MPQSHVTPLFYPLDFVFGLDMDIIVKFYLADYQIQHHGPVDIRTEAYSPRNTIPKQIVEVLRENGVNADTTSYFSRETDGDGVNTWAIDEGPFSALIDYDGEESSTKEWSFCTVKIVSPVLPYDYGSFFQLDHILKIIRENFEVDVSPSCGLNIHVGTTYPEDDDVVLESKGYPLQTLRNLLQLVSTFRPQLNSIHPPCRMSGKERQLPKDSFLRKMDAFDAAAAIESCDCITDLFMLWECSSSPTEPSRWINPICQISNLLSRAEYNSPDHPARTVLFRQHQATLDFERVYHWINFLIHLVRFSHECGPGGLPLSLLLEAGEERRTQAGKFDTISFMNSIGANASAEFYRDRLYTHESTPYLDDPEEDEDNKMPEIWEYIDSFYSAPKLNPNLILTPPRSSSSTSSSDCGGSFSFVDGSQSPGSDFPPSPPDSDTDWGFCKGGESSAIVSQGLSIETRTSEWSHVADVLTLYVGSNNNNNIGSVASSHGSNWDGGDVFRARLPPDFDVSDRPIVTTGDGGFACDLTHRKVQY